MLVPCLWATHSARGHHGRANGPKRTLMVDRRSDLPVSSLAELHKCQRPRCHQFVRGRSSQGLPMKGTAAVQAGGPGWSSPMPGPGAESWSTPSLCRLEKGGSSCLSEAQRCVPEGRWALEGRPLCWGEAGAGGETLLPLRFGTGGKPIYPSLPFMSTGKFMAAERHANT